MYQLSFVREDMWGAVQLLHERLSRVDYAKMIAADMVTKVTNHFEKVRESRTAVYVFF